LAFKFNRIDAEVSLQPSSIGIRADFSVSYTGEFSCVRCLGAYSRDYDVDMHLNYVEGEDPYLKSDNVEITAHDADKVYYQGPQIDLSIGICEAIILSQPIMHLCRDDCQGLCPVCGVNLNVKECFCKREKAGVFTPELSKDFDNQAKKGRRSSKD
jgi:uncharacterized metal-binding protein YceD (DUF177 family)